MVSSPRRTILLLVLLAGYAGALGGLPIGRGDRTFDPLTPRARLIEKQIVAGKYAEALPMAIELQRDYPTEPEVAYWLAIVFHGLQRPAEEVNAWQRYLELSTLPVEACPGLPDALDRTGRIDEAIAAYTRCTEYEPLDPERVIDLGDAYERHGRRDDASVAYRRAAAIDPGNPALAARQASPVEAAR